MTKIENAIYNTQLYVKAKEEQLMVVTAELKILREQLKTLEIIKDDKLTTED